MPPIDIFSLGPNVAIDAIVKIGSLIALAFYIIFAFVLMKQVNKMTDTLEVGMEGVLRFFALIHLLAAITAFIAVLIIL